MPHKDLNLCWPFVMFMRKVFSEVKVHRQMMFSAYPSLVDYLAQVKNAKKLSHHFLLHFLIGIGSYDHHTKYQGVFP